MSRRINPDDLHPILAFRFLVDLPEQKTNFPVYAKSTDLPKWNTENGWKNPIMINCYHFENITIDELVNLKKENIKLNIEILAPNGTEVIYMWKLIGNIINIDYGHADRALNDVTTATVTFLPENCEAAFQPEKTYDKRRI